jgi:hypothetical protein
MILKNQLDANEHRLPEIQTAPMQERLSIVDSLTQASAGSISWIDLREKIMWLHTPQPLLAL